MVTQNVQMDFFNYAGILRPVKLYTVPPQVNLEDVTINSSVSEDMTTATITFDLFVSFFPYNYHARIVSVKLRLGTHLLSWYFMVLCYIILLFFLTTTYLQNIFYGTDWRNSHSSWFIL